MNVFLAFVFLPLVTSIDLSPNNVEKQWSIFKKKFNQQFPDDEESERKSIFEKNLQEILNHNQEADLGKKTWRKAVTRFAALTREEFRNQHLNNHIKLQRSDQDFWNNSATAAPPKFIDWRTKGIVTGVKDQGQCVSDYAFSALGSLEGLHAKKTGTLIALSEQNLIDCSHSDGNIGCNGGIMDNAFDYIIRSNGVNGESSYPHRGVEGTCRFNPNNVKAKVKGYVYINQYSERDLQTATATIGPISSAVDASEFQFYSEGIFYNQYCSNVQLNHGITVVGYGTEAGYDYWIVKNSWGKNWGENGYIRMSRNQNNQCGIATMALYPVV